jgi:hypothetical protein
MCRYAYSGPYKTHFACFKCRKAFKQPPIEDYLAVQGRVHIYRELVACWSCEKKLTQRERKYGVKLDELRAEYHAAERQCPECGELMADLGLDFKPPRQNDVRAWTALQGVYRVGHVWRTCGCNGPGWIPKSKSEFQQYLVDTKSHYETQLRRTQDDSTLNSESKCEASNFWATRIQAIEKEMGTVS